MGPNPKHPASTNAPITAKPAAANWRTRNTQLIPTQNARAEHKVAVTQPQSAPQAPWRPRCAD